MFSHRFLACMVVLGTAAVTSAAEVQMQVQRVSLFKNGYSQVRLSGVLPDAAAVQVKNVPIPVWGTLKWKAPEGVKVERVTGRRTETEQVVPSERWSTIAGANAGRPVRVVCGKDAVYEGVIVSPVLNVEPPASAFLSGEIKMPEEKEFESGWGNIIVLRTEQGALTAFSSSNVEHIYFTDGAEPRVSTVKLPSAELSAQLSVAAPGSELGLECLAWGMSWLPEYRLTLSDDGKANLLGNIVVINDLMDMEKVQLELVTGSPEKGESTVSSPLVRLVGVKEYLESISSGRDWIEQLGEFKSPYAYYKRAHDTYRARAMAVTCTFAAEAETCVADGAGSEGGSQVEDLYYYSIPGFSCKRGEVAERELFAIEAPYEHVYTCSVPDQQALARSAQSDQSSQADIWHCLRLTNVGDMPWSTGVVTCFAGDKLIARSLLSYTAVGRKGLLPLNKTLEATVDCREVLVSKGYRKPKNRKFAAKNDDEDALPDVYQGELKISNNSDREMRLELKKAVTGTPTEASESGRISVSPSYRGNPMASIEWTLILAPGESKTLTYTYEYDTES